MTLADRAPDEQPYLLLREPTLSDHNGWPDSDVHPRPNTVPNRYVVVYLGPTGGNLLYVWSHTDVPEDATISAQLADWLIENRDDLVSQVQHIPWAAKALDLVILFLVNRSNGMTGSSVQAQERSQRLA